MTVTLTWPSIHRITAAEAMRAHRELGIDTSRPIDPFLALQRSGVLVMLQELDRMAGAYLPPTSENGGQPGVLINAVHPISRQRFTAAHELWHHRRDRNVVLDSETEWLVRGEQINSDRERLAEAFASWFLMPKRLVDETFAMLGLTPEVLDERSTYALSLELGTSYTATIRQLYGLKLIDRKLRDRLLATKPRTIKQAIGAAMIAEDPQRDVRIVGPAVRTRSVGAVEGDVVVVDLPEIPSSGYLWKATEIPASVNLVRDEYLANSEEAIGGNGVHRFVFSVMGSGQYPIRFELARPWLALRPAEVRDIDVNAQTKPVPGVFDPRVVVDPSILVGAAA